MEKELRDMFEVFVGDTVDKTRFSMQDKDQYEKLSDTLVVDEISIDSEAIIWYILRDENDFIILLTGNDFA